MNKKAFTLVELVVVILIIVILSGIWIISYISYLGDARDTQRKADIAILSSSLRLNKQEKWAFPRPWKSFTLSYKTRENILANQWKMDSDVILSNMDKLPMDPKTELPYTYSTTKNRQEYQIAYTIENSDIPKAMVEWNYKTVSVNILPSIVLAVEGTAWADVDISSVSNSFILSEQYDNLPYSIDVPFLPISGSNSLSNLIQELKQENLFWQNSDFRNCAQIKEAGKSLWKWENQYQIIDENWMLIDTICNFD